MQQWTCGPAVLPHLTDDAIQHHLRVVGSHHLGVFQAVTAHLTGEAKWLAEGAEAVKVKLASVLMEYRDSGRAAIPPDASPIFKDLCEHAAKPMLEDGFKGTSKELTHLQLEYIMDEMRGFPDILADTDLPADKLAKFHVAICGAGVHGISVAMRCQRAGIPYTILERDTDLSGTWHQNIYPGVRCDTPSITYSFSSDPNPNWKYYFASGHEVKEYIKRLCDKYGITKNCVTGATVESATFDESSSTWQVKYRKDGEEKVMNSNVFVAAVGQLTNPSIPKIPGQDKFKGPACHTARFIPGLDFKDKNVVVMGTGATAMGICPEIQKVAKHLAIFQGTPQWYVDIPNHKRPISLEEQWCMRYVPFYERWYRFNALRQIVGSYLDVLKSGSEANKSLEEELTEYIKRQVNFRPDLVEKMVPKYPPICTRMLVDNNWCTMMLEDNVTLINGRAQEIRSTEVVGPKGEVLPADVIIYATGFQSTRFCSASLKIFGKGGVELSEDWGLEPTAYLGLTRPKFPNFYMTYGPNTNVSSGGSIVWCAEIAGRYVGQCIAAMVRYGYKELAVKPEVHDEYNDYITQELKWTAWDDQRCVSWYKSGAGKVTNNLPMGLEEFWGRTRIVHLEDFNTKGP